MKLSLRIKLLSAFSIMLLALVIITVVSFYTITQMQMVLNDTFRNDFIPFQEIVHARQSYFQWVRRVDHMVEAESTEDYFRDQREAAQFREEMLKQVQGKISGRITPEGQIKIARIQELMGILEQIIQRLNNAARQNTLESALEQLAPEVDDLTQQLETAMNDFLALQEQQFSVQVATSEKNVAQMVTIIGVVVFLILLGTIITMFVIYRDLSKILNKVRKSTDELAVSTNQIAATTAQLTSNASETATALTEVTSTVEETRQTARLSNDKAKHVSDSAQKVSHVSQNGRTSVSQTIEAIKAIRNEMSQVAQSIMRLSEQTQSVGQIIGSVNELAEATNILSVNTSIEAARAGEHGKGFTVIAQEIRSLADRSKQATGRIREILTDIQKASSSTVLLTEQVDKKVENGVELSAQAGDTIEVLAGSVNESAQAATQIAASSSQQLAGMDQIAEAMSNINEASNQNANSLQQLESAMRNLDRLGENLKELVVVL
ncbi:MAG: HAMP domain-containing methyl-accepting chemotaxis protein [Chitinivibrionales bacterium]